MGRSKIRDDSTAIIGDQNVTLSNTAGDQRTYNGTQHFSTHRFEISVNDWSLQRVQVAQPLRNVPDLGYIEA